MALKERVRAAALDRLTEEGYTAGREGSPCKAPTPIEEIDRAAWEIGWRAGRRFLEGPVPPIQGINDTGLLETQLQEYEGYMEVLFKVRVPSADNRLLERTKATRFHTFAGIHWYKILVPKKEKGNRPLSSSYFV